MQIGQKLDVTVSALGNAKSLRGGVLLMTELRGADGQVYAIAQGSLLVSGFEASGQAASTTVNIPTVAHIPRGATIEKTPKAGFAAADTILLDLDNRSFGNAARIADAINARFGASRPRWDRPRSAFEEPAGGGRAVEFVADLLGYAGYPGGAERRGRDRCAERHRRHGRRRAYRSRRGGLWHVVGHGKRVPPGVAARARLAAGRTVVVPQTQLQTQRKEG